MEEYSPDPLLKFFDFEPTMDGENVIATIFQEFANDLCLILDKCPERTMALRKLLECRDCVIRAKSQQTPKKPILRD